MQILYNSGSPQVMLSNMLQNILFCKVCRVVKCSISRSVNLLLKLYKNNLQNVSCEKMNENVSKCVKT